MEDKTINTTITDDKTLINAMIVRDLIKEVVAGDAKNFSDHIAKTVALELMRVNPMELSKHLEYITLKGGKRDSYFNIVVKYIMEDLKGDDFNISSQAIFGFFSLATIDFNASSLSNRILENKFEHMLGGELYMGQLQRADPNYFVTLEQMKKEKDYLSLLRHVGSSHRSAMKGVFTITQMIKYYRSTLKQFEKMVHYQNVSLKKDFG